MKENLLISHGEDQSLENLCAQSEAGVLLYFYPKDMTSGCTTQAEQFRDAHSWFENRGVSVIGVSRDSLVRHNKFIEKSGLTFPLIADVDEVLCKAFDVIQEKSMYGRKYLGIARSTFLLDKEGNIVSQWRGVSIKTHLGEVQEAIEVWLNAGK